MRAPRHSRALPAGRKPQARSVRPCLPARRPDETTEKTFTAIASPVRRRILDLLADGDHPVNTLAESFAMSRPAISQHLRILLAAGLVSLNRRGREHLYRLQPENLAPVREWITRYERFWDAHLDALQTVLKKNALKRK